MNETICVGERPVQTQYRVRLGRELCEAHDLKPTDRVRVWIEKVVV